MTDGISDQPQGDVDGEVVQTPPAAPPVDVEALVSTRLNEWEEKRVKPLQRLISEREAEIERLKTGSMSEEQREQHEIAKQQQRIQELETRAWLAERKAANPTAAELYQRVLDLEDPDEQFAVFAELAGRLTPATPPPATPEASEQVPDILPNNPAPRTVSPGANVDPSQMTAEMRRRFLESTTFDV